MLYRRILSIMIPVIMCPMISFADYQAIVNIDTLNVRAKKDSTSTVLCEVSANARLDVSIEGDKWLKAKVKNKEGYLFQEYVDLYEVTSFGEATFKHNFPMKDTTMNFYKGEVVPVYDYFNGYYLVKKKHQYFYIHDSVVSVDKKSDIAKPTVIKNGMSTKLKSARLEKEEIVKIKQNEVKTEHTEEELISILDNNQTESYVLNYDSNIIKSAKPLEIAKSEDNIDLFDGYEIDIENVEQTKKIKNKKDNKKEEIVPKNTSDFDKLKYSKLVSDNGLDKFVNQSDLLSYAVEELGKPYVYGANGPSTFDCSGFTSYVFKKSGISIPRTSYLQAEKGESVDKNKLKSGDLVFFDTRSLSKLETEVDDPIDGAVVVQESIETVVSHDLEDTNFDKEKKKRVIIKPSKVTHVGIYIGDGKFIHASSGQKKVVINELDSKYYSERYYGAKRYR
ncbi:C40 family peptidase [Filifactor alocis]|uniref:C40 family peptidase n=1 Tax=Filifactor alocis TaxID=143361 RepID=UPI0028D3394B|nr:SH3 domain-containing C40 family peptidase [Filifactor alocis]